MVRCIKCTYKSCFGDAVAFYISGDEVNYLFEQITQVFGLSRLEAVTNQAAYEDVRIEKALLGYYILRLLSGQRLVGFGRMTCRSNSLKHMRERVHQQSKSKRCQKAFNHTHNYFVLLLSPYLNIDNFVDTPHYFQILIYQAPWNYYRI